MLLELARDLINTVEQDPSEPLPVVFNLSSWESDGAIFQKPARAFEEWLVNELRAKYNIPKKIAQPWVENDQLLLLLDGLDEVTAERREACVEAINAFREEHFVPIVVCSRVSDYDALSHQLRLQGAVMLQSLTEQQVERYLDRAGPELSSVREMLTEDTTLQELTRSPLMLNILTLAYRDIAPELLPAFDSIEARRKHLFDTYVQRMFERRGVGARYTPADTKQWLTWIAQKMQEHGQSVFLIERLQPSWLNSKGLQWIYTFGYWLFSGLILFLVFRLNWGIFIGLLLWLGSTVEKNILISVWDALLFGSGFSLFLGPLFLVYGLILILIKRGQTRSINTVEVLNWSWAGVRSELNLKDDRPVNKLTIVIGSLLGLSLIGYAMSQQYWYAFTFIGILGGSLYVLSSGLNNKEVEATVSPNQGIWQSAKNALIIAGISGLSFGISFGLPISLTVVLPLGSEYGVWVRSILGLILMLEFGWPLGTLMAFIGGLWYGGLAVIQHFTLRLILWFKGDIPRNLARFLDYAAERIFLLKVGGGYIFVHRLLLEHFARLEHEKRRNV